MPLPSLPNAHARDLAPRAAGFVVAAAYTAYAVRFWHTTDEGFAALRFARNLAQGAGLHFNPGETTPLAGYGDLPWVMLAAGFERLGVDAPLATNALSVALGAVLLVVVHRAARRHLGLGPGAAVAMAGLLASSPMLACGATGGLDATAFALATFVAFERLVLARDGRVAIRGGVAAAALIALRPEGVAWVALIGLAGIMGRWWDGREEDRPLPRTLRRDPRALLAPVLGALGIAVVLGGAWAALLVAWSPATWPTVPDPHASTRALRAGLAYLASVTTWSAIPAAAALGAAVGMRRRVAFAGPALVVVLGIALLAALVGDASPFARALLPALPIAGLLVGWLLDEAWRRLGAGSAATLAGAALVLGVLPAHDLGPPRSLRVALQFRDDDARNRSEFEEWRTISREAERDARLGRVMAANATPDQSWATAPFGARGYASGLVIRPLPEAAHEGGPKAARAGGPEPRALKLDPPDYLRAELLDGRTLVAELQTWDFGPEVQRAYVPELIPLGTGPWLVRLRLAGTGDDPAVIWSDLAGYASAALEASGAASGRRVAARAEDGARDRGSWRRVDEPADLATELIDALDHNLAPAGPSGVVAHEVGQASPGLTLIVSGHAPEATLVDLDGRPVHRWRFPFRSAFPDRVDERKERGAQSWRRAVVRPDGSLVALFEGLGVVAIDAGSRLLWAWPGDAHDALDVDAAGDVWVLTRGGSRLAELGDDVVQDGLTVLGADGAVRQRIGLAKALLAGPHRDLLDERALRAEDPIRASAVEVLDVPLPGAPSAFAPGNVVVASRGLDALLVLDPRSSRVVWASTGAVGRPHDVEALPKGGLLVFDGAAREGARVIALDPASGAASWSWSSTPERPLAGRYLGLAQRLPNGDTLITEAEAGRAVEVTPAGEIVWEYRTPHRAGGDDRYVATLFQVDRLSPETPTDWVLGPDKIAP